MLQGHRPHPPPTLLYLGYVGFAVNFAFAMAALHSGRLRMAPWLHWNRPWAPRLLVFLTAGIVLGSLGGPITSSAGAAGGSRIPVEYALLPWLLGTAPAFARPGELREAALTAMPMLLLSIFTFRLSLLGTFVVRSSCSPRYTPLRVDPSRGLALLLLLGFILTCALTLLALRADICAPLCPLLACCPKGAARRHHPAALRGLRQRAARHLPYPMVFQSLHLGSLSVGAPISIPSSCRWPSA